MRQVFTADQFTPTEYDTAADKAKFANHFVRFVESGFKRTLFPKWFYRRLSMTFGHIAHYDIHGFYAEWFALPSSQLAFLARTVAHIVAFGDPAYTYSDVERALAKWVKDAELIPAMTQRVNELTEQAELAELARLNAKYPNRV